MSRALEDKVTAVGVDRSGIAEIAKFDRWRRATEQPMRGITNWRDAASNHGAVWVKLDIAPPGA